MHRPLLGVSVLLLALTVTEASPGTPRDLEFEERVRAQEAIERVYYSHQIGTAKPFPAR